MAGEGLKSNVKSVQIIKRNGYGYEVNYTYVCPTCGYEGIKQESKMRLLDALQRAEELLTKGWVICEKSGVKL